MTIDVVQALGSSIQYVATLGQTVFPIPFPFVNNTDIVVKVGTVTLANGTDFNVTGAGNDTGGSLALAVGAAANAVYTVSRVLAVERLTEYQQNGPFTAAAINAELDNIVMIEQQLSDQFGRAIRIPATSTAPSAGLELNPASFAGAVMTMDANGNILPGVFATTPVTAAVIGGLVNPRTPAESAVGITPTNTNYYAGHLLRYGTNAVPGTTDMTQAFISMWAQAAQTGGADCYVPPGTYLCNSTFGAYPASVKTRGGGRDVTKIIKGFNGNTFSNIGNYAEVSSIWFAGNGAATFTGNWGTHAANSRSQLVRDCQISDYKAGVSAGVVTFADTTAGSQCVYDGVEIWQTGGTTGTGLYAFLIPDAVQAAAFPRHFHNIETQGNCGWSFGGSQDLFISDSVFADLAFTANSSSVHITNSRWLNQTGATINGHNSTITGCDILPQLTIASGVTACAIKGNSYNQLPIVDNSGNALNDIDHWEIAYTSGLVAGGTIHNGTINASYSRHGATISFDVNYTVGSTDTLSGTLEFLLPVARVSGLISQPGNAIITHSGTQYSAALQIPANVNFCTLLYTITGASLSAAATCAPVTATAPVNLATGDTIRLSGTYQL